MIHVGREIVNVGFYGRPKSVAFHSISKESRKKVLACDPDEGQVPTQKAPS